MHALYRMRFALPSLILALAACDSNPPPPPVPLSDTYLEALQKTEALKHSIEERNLEQQRIDELLGRNQTPAR